MQSFERRPTANLQRGVERVQPTAELTPINEQIYISNFQTGQRADLSKLGITGVLCLDRTSFVTPHPDPNVEAVLFELPTSRCMPHSLDCAVGELNRLCKRHDKVLVHCTHGQSRSVAVVAGSIAENTGRPALEVLQEVASRRDAESLVDNSFIRILKKMG